MSEQQIEGVPDGWRLVRIGVPRPGVDWVINHEQSPTVCAVVTLCENWPIIEKIEKPKRYRPFANAKEFEPHRDRWFRPKCSPDQCILTTAYNDRGHWTAKEQDTWEAMFELYTFDDGSPLGVEVTE